MEGSQEAACLSGSEKGHGGGEWGGGRAGVGAAGGRSCVLSWRLEGEGAAVSP
jgi:hypothetical protein